MKEKIIVCTATSPENLKTQLQGTFSNDKASYKYIALALDGPQVCVCPFNLPKLTVHEIRSRLELEVVELLSLPVDDIELDFQILRSTDEMVFGVFVCMPKTLIKEYLNIIDNAKLIPIKLTAMIIAKMEAFYQQHLQAENMYCILDYSQENRIHLAVFDQKQCQLIRDIHYEDNSEAKEEVVQSLRCASARSQKKSISRIYYSGDSLQNVFINDIENIFNCPSEQVDHIDIKSALCFEEKMFSINLVRSYSLTPAMRKWLLVSTNIFVSLYIAFCLASGYNVFQNSGVIKQIKSSYDSADYDYAIKLEKELRSL